VSVERITRKSGARVYRVRWREHGRNRARTFDRRPDAEAWDRDVKRRQQLGPLAVAQLTDIVATLAEWVIERWTPEHGATLALSTRASYAAVYGKLQFSLRRERLGIYGSEDHPEAFDLAHTRYEDSCPLMPVLVCEAHQPLEACPQCVIVGTVRVDAVALSGARLLERARTVRVAAVAAPDRDGRFVHGGTRLVPAAPGPAQPFGL
jgi:hypothetical protein